MIVSDYAVAVLGQDLTAVLAEQAPSACLRLHQMSREAVDDAPESLRAVDAMVLPHGYLQNLPYQDIYTDQWVCMVSGDNAEVGGTFTLEHLQRLPMVVYRRDPTAYTPAVKQLAMAGIEPAVVAVSESFLALPFLVAGTDRFALIQERLACRLSTAADVRILPCPFPVTPLVEALWWHPTYERDVGHRWFRGAFSQVRDRLGAPTAR